MIDTVLAFHVQGQSLTVEITTSDGEVLVITDYCCLYRRLDCWLLQYQAIKQVSLGI